MAVIWMEVTRDKYELPIVIADDAKELARITGADVRVIYSSASHYKRGDISKTRFHRIEIPEEELWM